MNGSIAAALLPLAMSMSMAAPAAAALPGERAAGVRAQAPGAAARHSGRRGLEGRLQLVTKTLKLSPAQQASVRQALLAQRAELRRLSAGPPDPEVPRVAAVHAITDRTSERIRAVLTDEQMKLYSRALPRDYAPGGGQADVEEWLHALRPKGNQAAP